MHRQFVDHCASLLQARFRGYIQKKRYRQFLPIYRRFRELLLAVTEGWKTRRILSLPQVKQQIQTIRTKNTNSHNSLCRIAKRELSDEIERLKRRGKWVETLIKNRSRKTTVGRNSKENMSVFGNLKTTHIKNIFSLDLRKKETGALLMNLKQIE